MRKSLRLFSCAVLGAAILAPTVVGNNHAQADSYYGRGYYNNYSYNPWYNNYYPTMVITTATMAIIQAIITIMAITTVTIITIQTITMAIIITIIMAITTIILVTTTTTNQVLTAIAMAICTTS